MDDTTYDPPITRSYISSASRVTKSKLLAAWLGISESEVYRKAIDELYERVEKRVAKEQDAQK